MIIIMIIKIRITLINELLLYSVLYFEWIKLIKSCVINNNHNQHFITSLLVGEDGAILGKPKGTIVTRQVCITYRWY